MIVWVLVVSLGYNNSYSVSGIESQAACNDLAAQFKQEYKVGVPTMNCYPYRAARP